jgi:hypothetical protein
VSLSNTVLQPHELALVQRVFKEIVSQPWFNRAGDNERNFAAFVVRAFQHGIMAEEALSAHCGQAAKERYALSG